MFEDLYLTIFPERRGRKQFQHPIPPAPLVKIRQKIESKNAFEAARDIAVKALDTNREFHDDVEEGTFRFVDHVTHGRISRSFLREASEKMGRKKLEAGLLGTGFVATEFIDRFLTPQRLGAGEDKRLHIELADQRAAQLQLRAGEEAISRAVGYGLKYTDAIRALNPGPLPALTLDAGGSVGQLAQTIAPILPVWDADP